MSEIRITNANFEEKAIKSDKPVLLDFWATWCPPCRMAAPELRALDEELNGGITVGKINVDEEERLADKFGIRNIPTFVLVKDGKTSPLAVGFKTKDELKALLKDAGAI